MKVITFSRFFPKQHVRAGDETEFVEKIWEGLGFFDGHSILPEVFEKWAEGSFTPKWHTIRAGMNWNVGDVFSPRVWSGAPYKSKQIEFVPGGLKIEKVWNFNILKDGYFLNGKLCDLKMITEIAKNDGLSADDFELWFAMHPKAKANKFSGQIICWNEHINY